MCAALRRASVISLKPTLRWTCPPALRFRGAREDAAYPWLSDEPPSHLFCLAPDGVCPAAGIAAGRGGLLPHLFTLTSRLPARRYVLCDTVHRRALKRAVRTCREARAASCPAVSGLSSPSLLNCGRRYPPAWDQRTWSDEPAPKPREDVKRPSRPMSNANTPSPKPRGARFARFYAASHHTMRPHWSHVGNAPVASPLPRTADSTSADTFRWQPPHVLPRTGAHTGCCRAAIRS